MSSYDISSYNLPKETLNDMRKTEFVQIDMQNSILQNKLKRMEKLIDEYEKKEAVSSRLIRMINKYVNYLSNSAKKFLISRFKKELEALVSVENGNDTDLYCLITDLTEFISGIKLIKKTKPEKPKTKAKQRTAKSTDFHMNIRNVYSDMVEENKKLREKLEKDSKQAKAPENAKAGGKILLNTDISKIHKNPQYDSVLIGKTLNVSKISGLKSLNSFFNDELKDNSIAVLPENKNTLKIENINHRESLVLQDNSVFLKKHNVTKNNTMINNLSINDITFEEEPGRARQEPKVDEGNWVIDEIEDCENEQSYYTLKDVSESMDVNSHLSNKNLMSKFNCVAESREQSMHQESQNQLQLKQKTLDIGEYSNKTSRSNETLKMESVFVYQQNKPNRKDSVDEPIKSGREAVKNTKLTTLYTSKLVKHHNKYSKLSDRNSKKPMNKQKSKLSFMDGEKKLGINKNFLSKANPKTKHIPLNLSKKSWLGDRAGKDMIKFKNDVRTRERCLFN